MMAVRSPPRTSKDAGEHVVVHDPHADEVDLSDLRGIKAPVKGPQEMSESMLSEIAQLSRILSNFFNIGSDDEIRNRKRRFGSIS